MLGIAGTKFVPVCGLFDSGNATLAGIPPYVMQQVQVMINAAVRLT